MPGDTSFQDLLRRVRAGEADAAAELVRGYESAIRRIVRLRLNDARLRRAFDSMDVCQSVLATFFVRAALGQYDLDGPDQLLKLLAQIARHKLNGHVRRERAGRRDCRRVQDDSWAGEGLAAPGPSPSEQVARRDLLEEVRRRLDPEEQELADLRAEGRDWAAIAAAKGESPEALRKRLARGLDRVAQQLGLDEASHE